MTSYYSRNRDIETSRAITSISTVLNIARNCYHGEDVIYTTTQRYYFTTLPNEACFLYTLYISRSSCRFRLISVSRRFIVPRSSKYWETNVAALGQMGNFYRDLIAKCFFLSSLLCLLFYDVSTHGKKKERKNFNTGGNAFLSLRYLH